jgi:hypothetical protein
VELNTDYLVVGAGASGLAFADTLMAESDADIVLVDRRLEPGGHWCDTYPFVRLHTPSRIYGVDSVQLGSDRKQAGGDNDGLYEQATGKEVQDYFRRVLRSVLEPSGRVRFLGGHEHLGGSGGEHVVRDLASGVEQVVHVRRSLVDARYLEAEIPATHTPTFTVAPGVPFGPLNALPDRAGGSSTYTVIGGGKTGVDACLWLLDQGTDPEKIRWIRPREAWFNDRRTAQPLDLIGATIQSISLAAEIIARGGDADTMLTQFEDAGQVMRLDQSTVPTMYRGSMLSIGEVERLRSISDVVRLGRLRKVEPDRLVLDDGEVTPRSDTLYGTCPRRSAPRCWGGSRRIGRTRSRRTGCARPTRTRRIRRTGPRCWPAPGRPPQCGAPSRSSPRGSAAAASTSEWSTSCVMTPSYGSPPTGCAATPDRPSSGSH